MVHKVPVCNLLNWTDCAVHGFLHRPLPFLPLCLCLSCSLCLHALCHFRGSKCHSSFKDQLRDHFPHEASISLPWTPSMLCLCIFYDLNHFLPYVKFIHSPAGSPVGLGSVVS